MLTPCPACKSASPKDGCTGSKFRCHSCGLHVVDERAARAHWRSRHGLHALFVDTKGRCFETTEAGIERREVWDECILRVKLEGSE